MLAWGADGAFHILHVRWGTSDIDCAKNGQPVVLTDLQCKGPARKEAYLLTAFLVTFVATKVTAPAAGGVESC